MRTSNRNLDVLRVVVGALIVLPATTLCAADGASPVAENVASPAAGSGPVKFELDVMPVLTAAGCNAGACHGKQHGQNGFQLSLLGFDAHFDFQAIVQEARGRRVFPAAPEQSLLLRKASQAVPHGGGRRLDPTGPQYEVIRRWITQGMPRRSADDPTLVGVVLDPPGRLLESGQEQRLTVTARYSDGSTRDVTLVTAFQSNEPAIVSVDAAGLVRAGQLAGEATIMARYMNCIATWNTAIPLAGSVDEALYARLPVANFIDPLVWDKLRQLRITPSGICDDATFLRRAHLDVIGRLPTPDEVREFLADSAPDKRARIVDQLLARPEYADYWANKWADLLRPNPYRVGIKATLSLDTWLRDAFRENRPYDRLVRELVTAQGSTWHNGAVTVFRDRREPDTRNYSRFYRQRLRAEVLLDAVCDVTGVPESFAAMPPGSRAVELWTHRIDSLFLDAFGRPDANQDPPCERTSDSTVVQTLHLMNAPRVHQKVVGDDGRAANLAASQLSPAHIVEELYLATYARLPSAEELTAVLPLFGESGDSRRRAAEDLLWALLNTPEFLFKD
jgi:hypothetical protein